MLSIETNARGGRGGQCHNITTQFKDPENLVNINGLIGVPDGEKVEIECQCLNPKKGMAEWTYNEKNVSTSTTTNHDEDDAEEDDGPSPVYITTEGSRVTLKVDSFRESSSGLYSCHSRDTTIDFNLTWYDPGKWQ